MKTVPKSLTVFRKRKYIFLAFVKLPCFFKIAVIRLGYFTGYAALYRDSNRSRRSLLAQIRWILATARQIS